MSSVREVSNSIIKQLESFEKTSQEIKKQVNINSEKLDRLQPQRHLPAILMAKQGVGISRTSNISTS